MSAILTHLGTGAFFGVVALLLVYRDQPVTRLEVGVVLLWSGIFGVLPDAELAFGMHRDLLTNLWVLFLVPPLVSARLMVEPVAKDPAVRSILLAAPASLASHLWLDTFGFSNRFAALFWPLDGTRFYGRPVRLTGFDDASVYILAVLWLIGTVVLHARMTGTLGGSPRRAYGLGLLLVVAEVFPVLLVVAVGWLWPL